MLQLKVFFKRFNMIKLKAKVNKSEIIRRLKIEADKRFKDSWQPELQSESFMKGVEELFKQLRLDDVIKCECKYNQGVISVCNSCVDSADIFAA
jgi:hypothetical protein|tara:strand:+ start:262 stop:543 length:282 start_codon:yes stop_codon:yes gene_type:complete